MAILSSCQYDPYAHKYTTNKPIDSELIGNYILELQTVDYAIEEFKDPLTGEIVTPKIEICKNGKYKITNLPYFKNFSPQYEKLISKEGTWKKSIVGSIGNGSGKIKDHWGMHLNGLPSELQNAGIMNIKAPYKIIFGFGDPDSGQVMIMKKE